MKRFVIVRSLTPEMAGLAGAGIIAVTGAGAGATWLIAVGLLAILLAIELGPERAELLRKKRLRGRSDADRSTGSR